MLLICFSSQMFFCYLFLVDVDTLQLLSREEELVRYRFQPRLAEFEEAAESMQGELAYDEAAGIIQSIEIQNVEPLSPAFSVTVDSYRLSFLFGADEDPRLLRRMESHAVGKAGFLKSFDSLVEVDFSGCRPGKAAAQGDAE